MSTRQVSDRDDPVIEDVRQLAEPMAAGEKALYAVHRGAFGAGVAEL